MNPEQIPAAKNSAKRVGAVTGKVGTGCTSHCASKILDVALPPAETEQALPTPVLLVEVESGTKVDVKGSVRTLDSIT